jgi:hypothetical protein
MKVTVGCEYSGRVRDAFIKRGHKATSCDLLPTETPGPHYQGDIFDILGDEDLLIAHPPCTFLANSGVRWLASKNPKQGFEWSEKYQIYINPVRWEQMVEGAMFFKKLYDSSKKGAIENPIMHKYALEIIGVKPTQIIQPWMFGHGETKATCLWLKNLPKLTPENIVDGREQRIWKLPPGPGRWKERSRTFEGIAEAMANQWGNVQECDASKAK